MSADDQGPKGWGASAGRDPARHQTVTDQDQTASDQDQTASDRDQRASDQDQTSGDRDQAASDRDQETADQDQQASDRDLAAGRDPASYERAKLLREQTTHDRLLTSEFRHESAVGRERAARARDKTARERDQAADLRDRIAHSHDEDAHTRDRASQISASEATDIDEFRVRAVKDRARAARDRERAARDREWAADQRAESARERAEAARDRELAATDQLTGARLRSVGLAELQREMDRARRSGGRLVLAFVDVDDLKAVNDSDGHIAGDSVLRHVAEALRAGLRSYDVIVRFGGDEFICALSNVGKEAAGRRFDEVVAVLGLNGHSISVGLAELQEEDDLQRLVARADRKLLGGRRLSGHGLRDDAVERIRALKAELESEQTSAG